MQLLRTQGQVNWRNRDHETMCLIFLVLSYSYTFPIQNIWFGIGSDSLSY